MVDLCMGHDPAVGVMVGLSIITKRNIKKKKNCQKRIKQSKEQWDSCTSKRIEVTLKSKESRQKTAIGLTIVKMK